MPVRPATVADALADALAVETVRVAGWQAGYPGMVVPGAETDVPEVQLVRR